MVEKIQDLNLPTAVVTRLIKDALPDGIIIAKEARIAISKAASVFIIYLSSAAINEAKKLKHKTMTPQNILDALEEIEFESFIEPLKECLEVYRKNMRDKKSSKQANDKDDKDGDAKDDEEEFEADEVEEKDE
ncbi:DNA polymerase epsilon subunit 3 [Bradysia coprophila]|uniref:DNA polymerase epsilon subunit 3 n=1 Tax=Bradysia coprophila TaxID=38358 RepID=UPI00187D6E81|nr:DNA polymerase epsilon subunit 3 [Bradysia coprophila]